MHIIHVAMPLHGFSWYDIHNTCTCILPLHKKHKHAYRLYNTLYHFLSHLHPPWELNVVLHCSLPFFLYVCVMLVFYCINSLTFFHYPTFVTCILMYLHVCAYVLVHSPFLYMCIKLLSHTYMYITQCTLPCYKTAI